MAVNKDDDYANLKHELMYEYDLLVHLKEEFDNMINEIEGEGGVEEDEEEEEEVDNDFFDEDDN